MNILYGAASIVGILFMLIFTFIGIWLFIVALKAFKQLKYKNYILEKIYQKLDKLTSEKHSEISDLKDTVDFFDLNKENIPDYNNVKMFDKTNDNK